MFGIIFGTVCLVALIRIATGGHRRRWAYGGHGYGHHHHPGHHHGDWGERRSWGPRAMLRRAFERLDTTPGQEKAIVAALEEFRPKMDESREELKRSRKDIAQALRGETLNREAAQATFERQHAWIAAAQNAGLAAMTKVHETLDPKQRIALADLIESGRRWGGGC